ncbi:MAG: MoxR family ATPase [Clostridia bacterium]|nr:MoxR family ATPase [Clostridia bacterium]MDR3645479.1 MoxR family ATPase [Clostridia bacterium]
MPQTIEVFGRVADNVERVIIGKRETVGLTLISLICEGHVLIEDVPGVGKTALVSAIAKSLDARFRRVQFTPDLLPSDITGFSLFNPKSGEFEYREGAVMCNILLADEINRTSPKTQSSLLEAMEEKQVTVDGITHTIPKPFLVLATENPVEYLGTHPLPEAQMDRFFMRVSLGYPDAAQENEILSTYRIENPLDALEAVASVDDILDAQRNVREIHVSPDVSGYIVSLVRATRANEYVLLGASPRGSLYLYRAAQAVALLSGRDYVVPDDVKKILLPVLAHRISLRPEARQKKVTAADILGAIVKGTRVPVK